MVIEGTFTIKVTMENNDSYFKIVCSSNDFEDEKLYYQLDDNVNQDNYSEYIEGYLFSGSSYLERSYDEVRVFQKPALIRDIYYHFNENQVVFSNTLETFFDLELDEKAVEKFLISGFIPGRKTFFKGVLKMLPGELIIVRKNGTKLHLENKWLLPIWIKQVHQSGSMKQRSFTFYKETFDKLLSDELSRISNVFGVHDQGILLSSGLDSGTILLKLAELKKIPRIAITAWFESKLAEREIEGAKQTARLFGIQHEIVKFTPTIFQEALEYSLPHMDAPVTDAAAILETYLAKMAQKMGVKLIYNGESADTLFGGGNTFILEKNRSLFMILSKIIEVLPRVPTRYKHKLERALSKYDIFDSQVRVWFDGMQINEFEQYRELTDNCNSRLSKISTFQFFVVRPYFDHSKIRLSTSANKLKYSLPFQALSIVSFSLRVPDKFKVSFIRDKILLRSLYEKQLGKRKKRSFLPPIMEYLDKKYIIGKVPKPFKEINLENLNEKGFGMHEGRVWRHFIFNYWYLNKLKKNQSNS